ncbi:UVI-1 protein [Sordaria brevicollis]|uniref:UVI-1 protein n=1 Tax=Sordaria brevicollis TaxID=83679 RepID=A0AAE0U308_SORBR|nr:UVI-1 protein [Sordaria brevicollis]
MRFLLISALATTLSSVAIAAPVSSQPATVELTTRATTVEESVNIVGDLSRKAQALQSPAQQISILNGPLIIVGQGPFPAIIQGFTEIINAADAFANKYGEGETVFDEAGCSDITTSYKQFTRVNQQLMNILIGKAGLFSTVPIIGQPVQAVLRQVEVRYDALGIFFVGQCEGKGNADIESNFQELRKTVTAAVNAYNSIA